MRVRKILTAFTVAVMTICIGAATFAENAVVDITVTPSAEHKAISPYIYGVNSGVDLSKVSAGAFRLGGNRLTAYNWENNVSNAGSDWKNFSDMYLMNNVAEGFRGMPAGAALNAAYEAQNGAVPYTMLTLQMAGYVSSSKTGVVSEENAAPSEYWKKVVNRKGSEFTLTPDTSDDSVYMDEYLNYLINYLGDSSSPTGFKAYALDNEPGLWHHTHSLVHGEPITCRELIEKTVDLASVVKDMDAGADVFGPSLFGYSAYDTLAGASDWAEIKASNEYRWFIDYYLDEMRKAEENDGRRLLDVLDVHFYTEAKGRCGKRATMCNHYDEDICVQARLDSVRSLYEEGYLERSWIVDTGAEFFPLLPNIQQSIDKYYPDTKIAFGEYNFGGGDHISGGVTQAEVLGVFAENGVYYATIWNFDKNEYQLSAINMFTNYDGMGSSFGDTLVKSEYDRSNISVFSSVDGNDERIVKILVTNRSIHDDTPVNITLSADSTYVSADVYSMYGDSPEIRRLDSVGAITGNSFSYTLPALSVTEFVIKVDESLLVEETIETIETSESTGVPVAAVAGGVIAAVAALAGVIIAIIRRKNRSAK